MKKAVLSLSGGLDSTCLLMWLLSNNYQIKAYSFFYNQKHSIELEKVKKNVALLHERGYELEHHIIDLSSCFDESNSSLKKGNDIIPEGHYASENMKSTVVENRNVIFAAIIYGKALSWANKEESPVEIFLGTHAGDHVIYPDCTETSRIACEHAFQVSNWGSERVSYQAPFNYKDKGDVLNEGLISMHLLGFNDDTINNVLSNTHTCYNPNEKGESCGKCGSCVERLEAFAANQMKDPIKYQIKLDE